VQAKILDDGRFVETPIFFGAAQIDHGCVTGICKHLQGLFIRLSGRRDPFHRGHGPQFDHLLQVDLQAGHASEVRFVGDGAKREGNDD